MISILFSLAIGYLFIKLLIQKSESKSLIFSLSLTLGIAIESIITFILMNTGLDKKEYILITDIIIILVLYFCTYKKRINYIQKSENNIRSKNIYYSIYILSLLFSILLFFIHIQKEPFGNWDGIFLWNFKTKFFYILHNYQINYKDFFNPMLKWCHLDYPMFLPIYNYKHQIFYSSEYNYLYNIYTAFAFFIATVMNLYGIIKETRGYKIAITATLTLLSLKCFIWEASSQCADIPLSLLILCGFSSVILYKKYNNDNFILLAYFFSGCAAACKNEGILFLILFLLITFKDIKNKRNVLLGAIFPVTMILYHKLFLSYQTDIFTEMNLPKIIDNIQNYKLLIMRYINNIYNNLPIILMLIYAFITKKIENNTYKQEVKKIYTLIIIIFVSYIIIYLITPSDLKWHLDTSSLRLMMQYIPLFIFAIFLTFNFNNENCK